MLGPIEDKMRRQGFLTVSEMAARSGFSDKIMYRLIHANKVKALKVGRFWYVETASVIRFMGPEAARFIGLKAPPPPPPEEK